MESPHLERISPAECRQLLAAAAVGRLVVSTPNFPTIEPVSFALVEGELVVAVRPGSAGDALAEGTQAAFEADVLDHELRRGWSVVVKGPVEYLDADVSALVKPQLAPWSPGGHRLLLVRSERISGQRIVSGLLGAVAENPSPADRTVHTRREVGTDEAFSLLRRGGQQVGRLAISLDREPLVFPLNYALDGDAIVFRTQTGTKLAGIARSLATFEVDHIDASGQGWAVTFEGLAQEVLEADPVSLRARIDALTLDTWPGGDRPHVVRITPYAIRGTAWVAAEVAADAPETAIAAF